MEPYTVPEHTYGAIKRWVEDRLPTGGFLEAVLDECERQYAARKDSK